MNISISLPPELVGFIEAEVESGRFASTSDVVREALRLLERAERRETEGPLEELRAAWAEGVVSGDDGPLDLEALKAEARRRLAARG
jgi:antitoxin ParD1/3/4